MKTHEKKHRKKPLRRSISVFKAFCRLSFPVAEAGVKHYKASLTEDDADVLHRLRVSLRRLRSLLWAFQPVLPKGKAKEWRSKLAEAATLAGETRDWDVLLETTLPKAQLEPTVYLDEFGAQIKTVRDESRARGRSRLQELKLDYLMTECVRTLAGREKKWRDPTQTVKKLARKQVQLALHELDKDIRATKEGDIEALHEVRIAIKRLRYLIEFFGPVLKRKYARRLDALVDLQTKLGELNDKAVALSRLETLSPVEKCNPAFADFKRWLDESTVSDARGLFRELQRFAV